MVTEQDLINWSSHVLHPLLFQDRILNPKLMNFANDCSEIKQNFDSDDSESMGYCT